MSFICLHLIRVLFFQHYVKHITINTRLIACKTYSLCIIYRPILFGYDFRKSMFLRRECTRIAGSLTVRSSRGNPAEEERSDNKETNLLSSPL